MSSLESYRRGLRILEFNVSLGERRRLTGTLFLENCPRFAYCTVQYICETTKVVVARAPV
jgi:hypothetical protein